MKTITIPKRFGYPTVDIEVNGIEHTFNTGVEIEVEDHYAEVIENALALAPKYGKAGGKIGQIAEGSTTEITVDDLIGVTKIVSYAFYTCRGVVKVTIPNSVKDIESHAFYGCSRLEALAIGNSVTSIANNVFDWCAKLARVYLPETPPTLSNVNAFDNINAACVFYCKTQESLNKYKAATNWSTLTGTYTFKVEG